MTEQESGRQLTSIVSHDGCLYAIDKYGKLWRLVRTRGDSHTWERVAGPPHV